METFAFPYHLIEVKYPESSTAVSFGGGYEFTSKPKAPDQVEYILNFKAMWFFANPDFSSVNLDYQPLVNMARLEDFYNRHKMYKKFIYPHQFKGNLVVRFAEPLNYKVVENGKGQVEPFSLRLKLQP